MENRRLRIQQLARESRGRFARPAFLDGLSRILNRTVDPKELVSLPETDRILGAYRKGYEATVRDSALAYRSHFSIEQIGRVLQLAGFLAKRLSGERVFLLTKQSEYCGAIQLNAEGVLKRTQEVIAFDGDSLCILSMDHQNGLLIDYNPDDRDWNYEVAVWGDRWALIWLTQKTY
jgi:hypothetical protein